MRKSAVAWLIAVLSLFMCLDNAVARTFTEADAVKLHELYRPDLDHYVYLKSDQVQPALDRPGSPWQVTGRIITLFTPDVPIPEAATTWAQRFYYVNHAIGQEGHVITPEQEGLAILANWSNFWTLEDPQYGRVVLPQNDRCPIGVPVYRIYNKSQGGAPNHRFTTDQAEYELLKSWGIGEGISFCGPTPGNPPTLPPLSPPPPPPPPGPPGDSAGKVDFYMTADGAVLTIVPTLIDGKVVALGADGQGFKLDPATITSGCWRGDTYGWLGNTKACAPSKDGKVLIPGLCNRDRGMPTLRAGEKDYYLDFTNQVIRWDLAGLQAKIVDGSFVEFAQTGKFEKPRVLVKDGNLVLAFNRDCETGFGLNGVPTDFSGELFKFTYVSTTGKDVDAFRGWDDVNKAVTVTWEKGKIKCQDTGSVKVFLPKRVSADGKTVEEWMPDPAGWLAIGSPPNAPDIIWDFGPGVEAVVKPPFHGFKYNLGC